MKNYSLKRLCKRAGLLFGLLSLGALLQANAETIFQQASLSLTAGGNSVIPVNLTNYTNIQLSFKVTWSGGASGVVASDDKGNVIACHQAGGAVNNVAKSGTISDNTVSSITFVSGSTTANCGSNRNGRATTITDILITGDAACSAATVSFADGATVAKYTVDTPFANALTTNNFSAQTWTSSNTTVADVDASGQVTLKGITGTTTIRVTQPAGGGICAVDASYTLNVTEGPVITYTPNPLPTLTYIEGQGPSQIETIYISGTNLPAGDVKIAPTNIQLSTSATGTFASTGITVVSNFAGGTLAPTAFYVLVPAGRPVGTYTTQFVTGFISPAGGGITLFSGERGYIDLVVTAAPTAPTLVVNPAALTGLDYVFGSGASAAKSFNVSGALLTAGAAINITAPANFEVSLSQTGGFAGTVSIPNTAGGSLAVTPIYVRLAAGKAINPAYTGTVTVTGGGDATVYNVALSGAVTPAPLPAPAVGTPDNATEFGFTAHWTAVANASGGYIVNVYQGGTFVKAVPVSGQATAQAVINGLQPSTTYTYKVIAAGDGVNNANSPESAASAPITTLMASVTITSPCGSAMIARYHSDLTEWQKIASSGSNSDVVSLMGSDGFKADYKPIVNAQGLSSGSNGMTVYFPPFEFLNGGYVVIDLTVSSNNRTMNLTATDSGATGITASITGGGTATGNSVSVGTGTYTVTYTLAASVNGIKSLLLKPSNSNMFISKITVCSNPGTSPIITTTPLPTVTQSMSATVGGNTNMKVIQVKGFNLTGDVSVSVVGDFAGYFTPTQTTIDLASALAGQNLGITYKSSSIPAMHSAQLKLSSAGAADVYVPLIGVSAPAGATPVIIADDAELPFWTTVISDAVQTLDVAGYNLTQDISLSITGADAGFFSVKPQSISRADALKGYSVNIVYSGDITFGTEHSATLVITSSGVTVQVPLKGYTLEKRPELFELKFAVSPAQAGYVTHTPGGTIFIKGTVVTAKVTPETDYVIDYWSDAGGNRSSERSFTVSDLKKGVITIFLREKGGVVPPPTAEFVAYPPESITQTGFTGSWSNAKDATAYEVNVYDANKNPIQNNLPAGLGNTLAISGLTAGTFYYYEVIAAVPSGTGIETTGLIGPFQTVEVSTPFVCGE